MDAAPQAIAVQNIVTSAAESSHLTKLKRVLDRSMDLIDLRLERYWNRRVESSGTQGSRWAAENRAFKDAIQAYQVTSPVALKHLELMGSGPGRIEIVDLAPMAPASAPALASSVEIEEIALREGTAL